MTREEEIKARLESITRIEICGAWTINGRLNEFINNAPDDIEYLLARNEELQREKEKIQAVGRALYLTSRNHPDWPGCRIVDAEKLKQFQPGWVGSEDAKEQDDETV